MGDAAAYGSPKQESGCGLEGHTGAISCRRGQGQAIRVIRELVEELEAWACRLFLEGSTQLVFLDFLRPRFDQLGSPLSYRGIPNFLIIGNALSKSKPQIRDSSVLDSHCRLSHPVCGFGRAGSSVTSKRVLKSSTRADQAVHNK